MTFGSFGKLRIISEGRVKAEAIYGWYCKLQGVVLNNIEKFSIGYGGQRRAPQM